MDEKKKLTNNAEMRALRELRSVIDSLLDEEFETKRKPALMALKIKKVEALPAKPESADMLGLEEMAEKPEDAELASEGLEMNPSKEMPSLEVKSEESDDLEESEDEEEDSEAVTKLKALLLKK